MKILGMIFVYGIFFPLVNLLALLLIWHPKVRSRIVFERKNAKEVNSRSFEDVLTKADLCFEFSSEGEYQQVASLIDDALVANKKIELVFFSPSVEKAMVELAAKNPVNIRIFRYSLLPLLSGSSTFGQWVTAETLILVRYDLFPEFLLWPHKLIMVWMTFKKEREFKKRVSWLKLQFLRKASKIIFAAEADRVQGRDLSVLGEAYDFRIEQIRRRISMRDNKFQKQFAAYGSFKTQLELFPKEKRLILGNAWPSDIFLLRDLPGDYSVTVVPHQLSPEIILAFQEGLKRLGRLPVEINDATSLVEKGDTFIINKKGVLCELYSDFGKAYVGGGFETSIHSVLEPLVAGSDQLAAGPMHHRSTEYDIAMELELMSEVRNPEAFKLWLAKKTSGQSTLEKLTPTFNLYPARRKEIILC